jgi:hypothetical protein
LEVAICNEDYPTPEYKIPIETRLVKYLRIWSDAPHCLTANGQPVEREIGFLLPLFICECLHYDPTKRLGSWWSDGVVRLRIEQLSQAAYKLIGVTWIGSEGFAPFEIDVELAPEIDTHFIKCIFRIGLLDDDGRPFVCNPKLIADDILDARPRSNRDWAMAVELTPPNEA